MCGTGRFCWWGSSGRFARSELGALDVVDVADHSAGLVIALLRSKTDQEGVGLQKAIPGGVMRRVVPGACAAGVTRGGGGHKRESQHETRSHRCCARDMCAMRGIAYIE